MSLHAYSVLLSANFEFRTGWSHKNSLGELSVYALGRAFAAKSPLEASDIFVFRGPAEMSLRIDQYAAAA